MMLSHRQWRDLCNCKVSRHTECQELQKELIYLSKRLIKILTLLLLPEILQVCPATLSSVVTESFKIIANKYFIFSLQN